MKFITVTLLSFSICFSAQASKQFMALEPMEHTLLYNKKFMALGDGDDPIKIEKRKQQFVSLKRKRHSYIPPKVNFDLPGLKSLDAQNQAKTIEKADKAEVADIAAEEESKKSTEIVEALESAAEGESELSIGVEHFWPVDENIRSLVTSLFGYRTHPVTGKYAFHKGVDIAAPRGTSVLASAKGEVVETKRHRLLGKYVKLRHADGTHSLYGHLHKINAVKGDFVRPGQKIGEIGSTGRSTGPHLDYSLRKQDGKPIDPLHYLRRRDMTDIAFRK